MTATMTWARTARPAARPTCQPAHQRRGAAKPADAGARRLRAGKGLMRAATCARPITNHIPGPPA